MGRDPAASSSPARRRRTRHRLPRAARPRRLGAALLGLLLLAPGAERAQARGSGDPDLIDLALHWARGDYRSPLVCDFGGELRRGLRRVLIAAGARDAARRTDRITLFDLEAEGATRCFSALAPDEPNLIGALRITLEATSRTDTALHDFRTQLRREGGFSYRIAAGRLRVGVVGGPEATLREVDFAGGTATLSRIEPGSDAARLLGEFGARRKLELTLEGPDASRFVLPLVEVAPR